MDPQNSVFYEAIRFLASSPTPEAITAFHPSPVVIERISALSAAEQEGTITDTERAELDHAMFLDYMMGLIKVEARKRLASPSTDLSPNL